jgi:multimeric flavodoxin WrbA
MDWPTRQVRSKKIEISGLSCMLNLKEEDLSSVYPGMVRYNLLLEHKNRHAVLFRNNSFEYTPQMGLNAREVSIQKSEEWEDYLTTQTEEALVSLLISQTRPACVRGSLRTDLVVIQASPRPDGNCSVLAGWAVDEARNNGRTAQVIFPDGLDIHPCIGCYQCYNTGTCTFSDDMDAIIDSLRHASLMVVCTPVYTGSVPGVLKLLIDRCQAWHAHRALTGDNAVPSCQLMAVAGRKGMSNFRCVKEILHAFASNLGMPEENGIFIDGTDDIRDIRRFEGLEATVKGEIRILLNKTSAED